MTQAGSGAQCGANDPDTSSGLRYDRGFSGLVASNAMGCRGDKPARNKYHDNDNPDQFPMLAKGIDLIPYSSLKTETLRHQDHDLDPSYKQGDDGGDHRDREIVVKLSHRVFNAQP